MASPVLLAALAVLAPAKPETPTAIARKAMASYRKAFLSRNADAIANATTEDFAYVKADGQRWERGPALASMRQGLAICKKVHRYDQTLLSARRTKEGVLMVADTYLEMTIEDRGKPGRVVSSQRSESLLVPRGSGWAYRRMRVLKESTTMPGGSMLDTKP